MSTWEIPFTDVHHAVLSVMPGESQKTFFDPLVGRTVRWEQDVYCPTFSVYDGRLVCVYRSYGDDEQWRMGLAWSDDGIHFEREEQPVFHARPEDAFLTVARRDERVSVSYGDSRLVADEDGTYFLLYNFFQHGVVPDQELAVASTRDFQNWTQHGRIFQNVADRDRDVIPEKSPWRFPHPAVVTRLAGDRLVAARIDGKYWMYLNCLSTVGECCLCLATSDNLIDWEIVRDEAGALVHPMPLRPGRFDSWYIDTAAAVVRDDGIWLIYNGINADPAESGDPRLLRSAHYPAQALFDRANPARLLQRSETPFLGGNPELEKLPRVFWVAPLYEAWSLVPLHGELLLYWNHDFGRRSVALSKAAIPGTIRRSDGRREMADMIGSSHINGQYSFTDEDSLNEGARLLLELGSRVIKVLLRENPERNYRFHSDWPPTSSLVELARTSYFRDLFDKPFTTFILMAFSPHRPPHYFIDSMSASDETEESDRFYEFARYLLTTYRGTGKTFVIQNWESDWVLTPPQGATIPVPSCPMDPAQADRMIAWFNARQDGIERARREIGTDSVQVVHAAEVNLIARAMEGEERVTNRVIPHTRCDLYSYSAWDTLNDPDRLRDALSFLRDSAPASALFGRDHVYVGEYGAAENGVGGPQEQLRIIRNATEAALDWGARYVVYWQLICDGLRHPVEGRPTNEDVSGWWLIRPDGSRPPVWDYFHGLLRGT